MNMVMNHGGPIRGVMTHSAENLFREAWSVSGEIDNRLSRPLDRQTLRTVASWGRLAVRLLLLFSFSLLIMPCFAHANQDVRVFVEADDEGRLDVRTEALRNALRQGVFQEADGLLHDRLEESRLTLLRELLASRTDDYVLGYAEKEYESTEWGAVLHVNVQVNRQALRDFLQSMGLFFTLDQHIDYDLATESFSSADTALIHNLETLSGLRRSGGDGLVLRLTRSVEGGWHGILDCEGLVWSAQGPDLPTVWAGLWGNYFTMDRVRQGLENSLKLQTQGWGSTIDAFGFDQVLRGWDVQAGSVRMIGMTMGRRGVEARWEIVAMDRPALEARLARVLQGMNIVYSIR